MPEAPLDQSGPFDPQQAGRGEVGLADQSLAVEGQVAHRGEIVEVAVFFQPRLRLVPGLLEFLVLHLQLDLVDLQFVNQALESPSDVSVWLRPLLELPLLSRSSARRRNSAAAVEGSVSSSWATVPRFR